MAKYCSKCGMLKENFGEFCENCETLNQNLIKKNNIIEGSIVTNSEKINNYNEKVLNKNEVELNYASFWNRAIAYIIDLSIIFLILFILIAGIFFKMGSIESNELLVKFLITFVIFITMYFAIMESSHKQGTVGKIAVNLKVVDKNGDRISFKVSLIRNIFKVGVSSIRIITFVNMIMIGVTKKKQSIHDLIVNTYVIKTKEGE